MGRDEELAQLLEAWSYTCDGHCTLVVVEASSGTGKTRLLQEFCQVIQPNARAVILGQGRTLVGQAPLESLLPVASYVQQDTDLLKEMSDDLRPWASVLRSTHPSWCEVWPDVADEKEEGDKFALSVEDAWLHLLHALGKHGRRVLVCLDDAQWLDPLSAQILRRWWLERSVETTGVMIVLGLRSLENRSLWGLREGDLSRWMILGPLSLEVCRKWGRVWLGDLPDNVLGKLYLISGGNPFFFSTVLRAFAQQREAEGWTFDTVEQASLTWLAQSQDAEILVTPVLEELPPLLSKILGLASLHGRRFEIRAVAEVLGKPRRLVLRLLELAEGMHLVHLEDTVWASFSHDKLREAVLERQSHEEQTQGHQDLARWLSKQPDVDPFGVAYHLYMARCYEEAVPFALQAAYKARQRGAMAQAAEYFVMAYEGMSSQHVDQRLEVVMVLGECLLFEGRYSDARAWMEKAWPLAQTPEEMVRLELSLGVVCARNNETVLARKYLESALRRTQIWMPRGTLGVFLLLFRELVLFPWFWLRAKVTAQKVEASPLWIQRGHLYCEAISAYLLLQDYVAVLAGTLYNLNRLGLYKNSGELSRTKVGIIYIVLTTGRQEHARQLAMDALERAKTCKGGVSTMEANNAYLLVTYTQNDLQEARRFSLEALLFSRRQGYHWGGTLTLYLSGCVLWRLGRLSEAFQTGVELFQRASKAQEHLLMFAACVLLHRATEGRCAWLLADFEGGDYTHLDSSYQGFWSQCWAWRLLQEGRVEEALPVLEHSCQKSIESGLDFHLDVVLVHLETLCVAWFQASASERPALCLRWREARDKVRKLSQTFSGCHAGFWRAEAWWNVHHGTKEAVKEALKTSLAEALKENMLLEEAKTRIAQAEIELLWGEDDAASRLEEAHLVVEQLLPAPEQLHLLLALVPR